MKITFFLPTGTIEWPIPSDLQEQFNFNATAVKFRLDGFFIANDLYLRHDMVVGMIYTGEPAKPAAAPQGTLQ